MDNTEHSSPRSQDFTIGGVKVVAREMEVADEAIRIQRAGLVVSIEKPKAQTLQALVRHELAQDGVSISSALSTTVKPAAANISFSSQSGTARLKPVSYDSLCTTCTSLERFKTWQEIEDAVKKIPEAPKVTAPVATSGLIQRGASSRSNEKGRA